MRSSTRGIPPTPPRATVWGLALVKRVMDIVGGDISGGKPGGGGQRVHREAEEEAGWIGRNCSISCCSPGRRWSCSVSPWLWTAGLRLSGGRGGKPHRHCELRALRLLPGGGLCQRRSPLSEGQPVGPGAPLGVPAAGGRALPRAVDAGRLPGGEYLVRRLQRLSGLYYRSPWFGSLAAYYLLLSVMRFLLARYARRHGFQGNKPAQ